MDQDTGLRTAKGPCTYESFLQNDDLVRLRVPREHRYITVIRNTVDAFSEQIGMDKDARAGICLAVGEACTNAVQHAPMSFPFESDHIYAVCRIHKFHLEVEVMSRGNEFQPLPGVKTMPEPLAESGRGLALMECLMDSVEYISRDGNTIIRLKKRLPAPRPTAD